MGNKAKTNIGSSQRVSLTTLLHFEVEVILILSIFSGVATPNLTNDSETLIDNLYQMRMETLFSIDDLVKEVVSALKVCRGARDRYEESL